MPLALVFWENIQNLAPGCQKVVNSDTKIILSEPTPFTLLDAGRGDFDFYLVPAVFTFLLSKSI